MIPVPASELVCASVVLFRGCIDENMQQLMYQELLLLSEGSEEHTQLNALCPAQQPWPLAYWNHPYTHESNTTAKPEKLLSWANDLLGHGLTQASAVPGAAAAGDADSMLCQLYPQDGYLRPHVDNQLGYRRSNTLSLITHCTHAADTNALSAYLLTAVVTDGEFRFLWATQLDWHLEWVLTGA